MPAPQNVNPQKFKVLNVLYDYDDFSVALGTWTPSSTKAIAMRWNYGLDGNGYPKVFAHPQWFLVSEHIGKNILSGLLTNPNVTLQQYSDILDALKIF